MENYSFSGLKIELSERKPYNDSSSGSFLFFYLHGIKTVREESSEIIILRSKSIFGIDPAKYQDVCFEDSPTVEYIAQVDFFSCKLDFLNTELIGQVERRDIGKAFTSRRKNIGKNVSYDTNVIVAKSLMIKCSLEITAAFRANNS